MGGLAIPPRHAHNSGRVKAFLNADRNCCPIMFVFKGTAAADLSKDGKERDWRVTDHYNIQQLGRRPFTTMVQPTLHQRSLTEDTRRSSLLQVRSRSNSSTASQTILEGGKLSPIPSVDRYTPRTSSERRSFSGASIHKRAASSESFGRTLMAKGSRLLRRNNSKQDLDLTSLHTLEWLEDVNARNNTRESSSRAGSMHSPIRPNGDGESTSLGIGRHVILNQWLDGSPRLNISEPFNFQHLTHTTPQHAERIQQTSPDDLISEFSAIRAAQIPRRELRGIKAINIQPGRSFSEASASGTSSPPWTGFLNSPPDSPARDRSGTNVTSPTLPSPRTQMKHKRSVENFSQPTLSYHAAQTSPKSPPPRSSSRSFVPGFLTSHHEPPDNTALDSHSHGKDSEPSEYSAAVWDDPVHDLSLPHAVTTPDESALSIQPLSFSIIRTELAGVPEEDETSEGKRSSISASIVRPTTPTSSIRYTKSFPSTKSSPQRWSGALPLTAEEDDDRPLRDSISSACFVAPCGEDHMGEMPAQPHGPGRISFRREESWEDVIDYCYEHEAEADCSFDWELASNSEGSISQLTNSTIRLTDDSESKVEHALDGAGINQESRKSTRIASKPSSSTYSSSTPLLLPLQTSLPDLQPPTAGSTESSFSSIPEAVTPLPMESMIPIKPSSANLSVPVPDIPYVVPDSDPDYVFDDLYQGMLASHNTSENQLPFPMGRPEGSTISNSPRSSRPISKSSSQESFWHSQAAAAARRHRNTASLGSLPDLIPSRSNDKPDLNSDHSVEQIALPNTPDTPSDGSQPRRSPSLAKDVALKSIMSKVTTPDSGEVPEVPLPIHPAFRDRATSDATPLLLNNAVPLPPQPAPARRMRSTSSASSLSRNRASYSLFPFPATR